MATTKVFSRALYDQWDEIAKTAGLLYLATIEGISHVAVGTRLGVDLMYYCLPNARGTRRSRGLECEVKLTWKGGAFPYEDIQVLARKERHFLAGHDLMLLAEDLTSYLIIPAKAVLKSPKQVVHNRFCPSGEEFFKVSLKHARFGTLAVPPKQGVVAECSRCSTKCFNIVKGKLLCQSCLNPL